MIQLFFNLVFTDINDWLVESDATRVSLEHRFLFRSRFHRWRMVYESHASVRVDGVFGAPVGHVCRWHGWRRVSEGLQAHAAGWGRDCGVSSATMRSADASWCGSILPTMVSTTLVMTFSNVSLYNRNNIIIFYATRYFIANFS